MTSTDHPSSSPQATPFAGVACFASARHVRRAADLVTTEGNRWSRPGQPTIYLAGDAALALAEFARHATRESAPAGSVWEVSVRLAAVADLRAEVLHSPLGSPGSAAGALDHDACRALADKIRATGSYEAMLVPSVAMLDRADRWNVVVFVERLRGGLDRALTIGPRVVAVAPGRPAAGAPAS